MKKVVLKLEILDEKVKQKAMKHVSGLTGVDAIAIDMKEKKLTVTGDVDPVSVVSKLRKVCYTDIVSVGPAKEDDGKKKAEEEKKKKAEEEKKKKEEEEKKRAEAMKAAYAAYQKQQQQQQQQQAYYQQQQQQLYNYYNQQQQPYNYQYNYPSYSKVVQEETPNCVIC